MQNVIEMDTRCQGLTQEERRLLCQLFDEAVQGDRDVPPPPLDPSSNNGGKK
jgi:hypothetical protein